MKVYFEVRDNIPLLVTEDNEIVENAQVTKHRAIVEETKEGPMYRLIVEVKILEQREVPIK